MRRLGFWSADSSGLTRQDIDEVLLLTREGRAHVPGQGDELDCLAILPGDGKLTAGLALVPPALDRVGSLNGAPLCTGLELLQDRDRLDLGGRRFWIAVRAVVEETAYDPEQGGDMFCARTRRRIQPGERVVACPGCELIFSATAWKAGVRCHQCGFDPNREPWRPPPAEEPAQRLVDRFRGSWGRRRA